LSADITAEPDDVPMTYDGPAGVADTRLIPPTTVVPESLLGFLGMASAIPLVTRGRRVLSFLKRHR